MSVKANSLSEKIIKGEGKRWQKRLAKFRVSSTISSLEESGLEQEFIDKAFPKELIDARSISAQQPAAEARSYFGAYLNTTEELAKWGKRAVLIIPFAMVMPYIDRMNESIENAAPSGYALTGLFGLCISMMLFNTLKALVTQEAIKDKYKEANHWAKAQAAQKPSGQQPA